VHGPVADFGYPCFTAIHQLDRFVNGRARLLILCVYGIAVAPEVFDLLLQFDHTPMLLTSA
jgi:hypothetical protein